MKNILSAAIIISLISTGASTNEFKAEFPGFPCQRKAAVIANGAAVAIAAKDIGMVALRYVQANAGYYAARSEFIGFLGIAGLLVLSLHPIPASAAALLSLVQIGNMLRHTATCMQCETSLNPSLQSSLVAIPYSGAKDKHLVVELLRRFVVDCSSVMSYAPRLATLVDD